MKIPLNMTSVFLCVTLAALVGMLLGGAFGYAAGLMAPDLFTHVLPMQEFEPIGVAVVFGAVGGVLCGGGLGVFAVAVQGFADWLASRRTEKA